MNKDTIVELLPKNISIHISSWKRNNGIEIFLDTLENREVSVTLNYPLKIQHTFNFLTKEGSVSELITKIVLEYKKVYKNHTKYGIWGHCLGDLWIESIILDTATNNIELYIGS